MGTVAWIGKRRPPRQGIYRVCRENSILWFQCRGCSKCHGDGLIRVGTRRGRGRGRKRGKGKKGSGKRLLWTLGLCGAFIGAGNAKLGTFGAVGATVLVGLFLSMKLVFAVTRAVTR